MKPDYNHDFNTFLSAYPAIRKLYKGKKFKEQVKGMKKAGIEAKQTHNSLLKENQNNPVTLRDIYNQRHIIRRDDLRGKRFIQTLLIALTDLSI